MAVERWGRYALAGAALVAVIALGARYGLDRQAEAPAAEGQAPAGDVGTVIRQLEQKMAGKPNDSEGWRLLGWSYFSQGRYADATRAYARATALAPNQGELWSALGEALVFAKPGGAVGPDAARAFARAVELDPKDARARYFLAVKRDMDGDHKGAVDDWIALLRDTPPGAPWEQSVRDLVLKVATREKIDVAGRLPAARPAPPPGPSGAEVATAAIPGPTADQLRDAARMSPREQDAMVQSMVDRLAARLSDNPRDADGWIRLMRARTMLDDKGGAAKALAQGRAAFANDAATRARLDEAAKALGVGG